MDILIAEDDLTSRKLLAAVLRKAGHHVVEAKDGEEAWDILQDPNAPRLALLDWMMPHLDGLELCRRARALDLDAPVYIIMVTALGEKKRLCEALDAGADDYLEKPYNADELSARVRVAERTLRLQQRLALEARTDPLTGLPNRAGVFEHLRCELARMQRHGGALGVALVDVDHFKRVNDTHGHPVGDQVLEMLAQRCRSVLRPYDTAGRYGGEEFLVIAPQPDHDDGLWERMCQAIRGESFDTPAGPLNLSISVGATRGDGTSSDADLLAAADRALYRAKARGRDRVEVEAPSGRLTGELGESQPGAYRNQREREIVRTA